MCRYVQKRVKYYKMWGKKLFALRAKIFRLLRLQFLVFFFLKKIVSLKILPLIKFVTASETCVKMDVNNGVVSYTRRIDFLTARCSLQENPGHESPYDMCVISIGGQQTSFSLSIHFTLSIYLSIHLFIYIFLSRFSLIIYLSKSILLQIYK